MCWRQATLLLWLVIAVPAASLGLFPVWGWPSPSRPKWPKPWPAFATWLVVALPTLYMTVPLLIDARFKEGNLSFKVCVLIFSSLCRFVESWERSSQRGPLCLFIRCAYLYCARYPLSTRGWRTLCITTLFCSLHSVLTTYVALWWQPEKVFSWLNLLHGVYSGSLHLVCIVPAVFIGQLAADLRHDLERVAEGRGCCRVLPERGALRRYSSGATTPDRDHRSEFDVPAKQTPLQSKSAPVPTEAGPPPQSSKAVPLPGAYTDDEPAVGHGLPHASVDFGIDLSFSRYRIETVIETEGSLGPFDDATLVRQMRVRQQVIDDMHSAACAMTRWQVLVLVMYTLMYCTVSVSTGVAILIREGESDDCEDEKGRYSLPLVTGVGRVVLFVLSCIAFEKTPREHLRLSEGLQSCLTCAPEASDSAVREEVEQFIIQIGQQNGYFDVLGMFLLDNSTMTGVLFAISTYLVALIQLRLSLY